MPALIRLLQKFLLVALVTGLALSPGCRRSSSSRTVVTTTIIPSTGIVATDLRSIADYIALPEVQELFRHMTRNAGTSPPAPTGEIVSDNLQITFTTLPGYSLGALLDPATFCLGAISGGEIDIVIDEVDFVDVGAPAFIEGESDFFTIYLAHKSIQADSTGATCEIHLVRVISATLENDGSLSDLEIGTAVIGIVGACENLFVGDVKVAAGTGDPTGNTCSTDVGPIDPDRVEVVIENNLLVDLDVFTSLDGFLTDQSFVEVPPLDITVFEEIPGFELEFASLQPQHPSGDFLGEVLFKRFEPDPALPGETVIYQITNDIDENLFFAPTVTNDTGQSLIPSVNIGIPDSPDGWFCDNCTIDPGETHFLGYYAYDILAQIEGTDIVFEWTPDDVNIGFFTNPFAIPVSPAFTINTFEQPGFELEALTGGIDLFLPDDAFGAIVP